MIKPSQPISFYFGVQNPSTGAAVNADSTPTCVVYKNGAVDVAVTPTVTNPATGSYKVVFSVPSGYAAGDIVEVLATATVSSVSSPPTSVFLDTVDTARESETYARLGAPAGASIAADVAATPAAVWAVGTRTLTSFGTLVADIWANVTRTLTSGGLTAQQVWEYATRTITGGGGSAADIWAYATRTLTETVAVVPAVSELDLTAFRGTTWTLSLTVGALTGNSKVWFTVKDDVTKADTEAYLQVEKTAGLVRFNGASASAGAAALVVTNEATGEITLTVQETVTQNAPLRRGLTWDLKALVNGDATIKARGTLDVVADVTRAIS